MVLMRECHTWAATAAALALVLAAAQVSARSSALTAAPPPAADSQCIISWASEANRLPVRDVTLSNSCPMYSDGCSGPSDALPFQDKLAPCCNAHDWCYTCGWKAGLKGIEGRRTCDRTLQRNLKRTCTMHFSNDPVSQDQCFDTADAMYAAVMVSQDATGMSSSSYADQCPGDSWKLAHADFCFNMKYELSGIVKVLSAGNGGQWGFWTNFSSCPEGTWTSGFSARVLPYQGPMRDDTALNAVQMTCSDKQGSIQATNLKSHDGWRGDWSTYSSCPSGQHMTAFRLQVEPPQGAFRDDTAANTLETKCSDGQTVITHSNSLGLGTWSDWVSCPAGTAVCAFKIRIEQQRAVDNTAMNDIEMACCSLA